MSPNYCFLPFFSLILSFPPLISSSSSSISSSSTISIPLAFFNTPSDQDPYERLSNIASLSLARARQLKSPKTPTSVSTTPLSPHSYGAYSISLKFGTPPQSIPFILDTGSSFVWFPCTQRYVCKNCSPKGEDIASFIPKASSSVKILGCMNSKCTWIHNNTDSSTRCRDCQPPNTKNCKQICPPYLLIYGSGSTSGITLVETLGLPNKKVPNFIVGCSLFSSHQPAGIAGFGRGLSSLPSQLGLKKFSYCLVSHKFDDSSRTSALLLDGDLDSDKKTSNLSYTRFLKNPALPGRNPLSVFYYVGLRKITIGGQKVKIPYKYLIPDEYGNGGAIVDSGTTFTFMNNNVFKPVLNAFVEQVKGYKRALDVESKTGLKPCFNVSGQQIVSLPELKFHFKGGAKMALPLANYFFVVGGEVVCLTMVTSNFYGPDLSSGPSIILGNFQMQNYQVEYDLRNQRFGFRQQICR